MGQRRPLDDARAVLAEAQDQVDQLRGLYQQSLHDQQPGSKIRVLVKNTLENERSALDYLAHEVVERWGRTGKRCYFPLAATLAEFPRRAAENLPGVQAGRPDLMPVFERHQPFQPGREALGHLASHVNPIKHRALTPQVGVRKVNVGMAFAMDVDPLDPVETALHPGVTYVDWLFDGTRLSVLGTLDDIQHDVGRVLDDFGQVLGW